MKQSGTAARCYPGIRWRMSMKQKRVRMGRCAHPHSKGLAEASTLLDSERHELRDEIGRAEAHPLAQAQAAGAADEWTGRHGSERNLQ